MAVVREAAVQREYMPLLMFASLLLTDESRTMQLEGM